MPLGRILLRGRSYPRHLTHLASSHLYNLTRAVPISLVRDKLKSSMLKALVHSHPVLKWPVLDLVPVQIPKPSHASSITKTQKAVNMPCARGK